jgi:hypothetical protein
MQTVRKSLIERMIIKNLISNQHKFGSTQYFVNKCLFLGTMKFLTCKSGLYFIQILFYSEY